jgi:hypothetical protein
MPKSLFGGASSIRALGTAFSLPGTESIVRTIGLMATEAHADITTLGVRSRWPVRLSERPERAHRPGRDRRRHRSMPRGRSLRLGGSGRGAPLEDVNKLTQLEDGGRRADWHCLRFLAHKENCIFESQCYLPIV